jgi:hypothetical protein
MESREREILDNLTFSADPTILVSFVNRSSDRSLVQVGVGF